MALLTGQQVKTMPLKAEYEKIAARGRGFRRQERTHSAERQIQETEIDREQAVRSERIEAERDEFALRDRSTATECRSNPARKTKSSCLTPKIRNGSLATPCQHTLAEATAPGKT